MPLVFIRCNDMLQICKYLRIKINFTLNIAQPPKQEIGHHHAISGTLDTPSACSNQHA